ncbi:MAG: CAP domain-containing protein [Gemmataceae bacterium]
MRTIQSVLVFSCVAALAAQAFVQADGAKEPAKTELTQDEKAFFDLTNQARTRAKLPALSLNPHLLRAARDHAANMAKKGEMNHLLDGHDAAQRVKGQGYDYEKVAENIAAYEKCTSADVFKGWMDSQHNKDNILNEEFKEVGIGIGKNDKGEVYYALVFASARPKR